MAAMRASETAATAMLENTLVHHEEAFCLRRRNPYSIHDDATAFVVSIAPRRNFDDMVYAPASPDIRKPAVGCCLLRACSRAGTAPRRLRTPGRRCRPCRCRITRHGGGAANESGSDQRPSGAA